MKSCPQCNAQYEDDMSFCLQDGTPLQTPNLTQSATERLDEKTVALHSAPVSQPTVFQAPPTQAQYNQTQHSQPTQQFVQSPTDWQQKQPQPAPRKSNTGLLIAIPVILLALIGLAGGGGWWYLRNQKNKNLASVESNKAQTFAPDSNSISNLSDNSNLANNSNSNSNLSNVNTLEVINNNSDLKSVVNNSPKPTPTIANVSKATPTPVNKSTPQFDSATSLTSNPELDTAQPSLRKTPTPRPNIPKTVSAGVVNGKASNLVRPTYPPAARAVRASGAVNVQVTIDENGNVISASAVSGHPLLRQSAESAARQSKFNPTVLSGQPVKVTGIIVYNFVAQ